MKEIKGQSFLQNHPCYNKAASANWGRLHLPVAPNCNIQCNYCNRKYDCANENRPGVTQHVYTPQEAAAFVRKVFDARQDISVVGIAGPGDPMCDADKTLETFRLVKKDFPHVMLCLSSNGLAVPDYVNDIADLGITHVTITANAIDPEIAKNVYSMVRYEGNIYKGIDMIEDHVESGGKQFNAQDLLTICMWIGLALGIGTIVSAGLSILTPLPAYIGAMICAAVIRNFGDFTKAYKINDAALDAVSNVALSLFVTMAINSLKLVQLIDLALPLITILVAQMALICVFAYLIYFIFGRNYDAVMLGAGAIGFGLGATPNALVNMLSLAGKHGPSPRAWLVVSLVGAFLIDFANAFLITTMAGILY